MVPPGGWKDGHKNTNKGRRLCDIISLKTENNLTPQGQQYCFSVANLPKCFKKTQRSRQGQTIKHVGN